jgi:hypothetical protein
MAVYLEYALFKIAQVQQDSSGRIKTKLFEFTAANV